MAQSVLSSKRTIVAMHRFYMQLVQTCERLADLSLPEYTILTCIAEKDGGFSLKKFRTLFELDTDPMSFIDMLEEKELIARVRDKNDRRAFVLVCTEKGEERLRIADKGVASEIITLNPRIAERSFLRFANLMHSMCRSIGFPTSSDYIFTGPALSFIDAYHRAAMRESSYFGLTSLQMGILSSFDGNGEYHRGVEDPRLLSTADSIHGQLRYLESNGYVLTGKILEITQKGVERQKAFADRLENDLRDILSVLPGASFILFVEFCDLCVYLFS